MIEPIVGYESALAYWSNPLVPNPAVFASGAHVDEALRSVHHSMKTRQAAQLLSRPLFEFFPKPIDILTSYQTDRRHTKRLHFHYWKSALPEQSVVVIDNSYSRVGNELCRPLVSSPELCFIQLARLLEFEELVELGYELCGDYAVCLQTDKGMVNCSRRTSPGNLCGFANAVHGAAGVAAARKAANMIIAGSRSPKESQIAILLCAPQSIGGFELPRPLLNPKIDLNPEAAALFGYDTCHPDFFWPEISTVMEYDSRDWHVDSESDARKRSAYRLMGLDVITLTSGQLHDLHLFTILANDLHKRLKGRKPAEQPEALLNARQKLHHKLLYGSRHDRFISPNLISLLADSR